MVVANGGYVGIGTAGPAEKLHVTGNVQADTYLYNSSREYKQNIEPLSTDNALKAFKELNPVTFSFKTDPNSQQLGFIAEEIPDLAAVKNRKSVDPMKIIAILAKVGQKQQEEIQDLRRRLDELQAIIED